MKTEELDWLEQMEKAANGVTMSDPMGAVLRCYLNRLAHHAPALIAAAREMAMINELRKEEGSSVEIISPNADFGGPNEAVEVCADWTWWDAQRFEGDTLFACLQSAVEAKQAAAGSK